MDSNWGYVALGYGGTFVVLVTYCGRLWLRSRREGRS
jgi:hypothetical protein